MQKRGCRRSAAWNWLARLMHTNSAAGSIETDATDVTVMPIHRAPSLQVAMLTVDAKRRIAERKGCARSWLTRQT